MKQIALSQGKFAKVDDDDFERLNAVKWCAKWNPKTISFYAVRTIRSGEKRSRILMHREILAAAPGQLVDHRNHKTLDNQKSNLRVCSSSENCQNRLPRITSETGFKGVGRKSRGSTRWYARIRAEGRIIHLGYFSTPQEAAMVYDVAAIRYFGEFALTNAGLVAARPEQASGVVSDREGFREPT
jgi:hypothetical protein